MFDLSLLVSAELPFPADILRDYALEFEIRVEKAPVDLRECLRKAFREKYCCREMTDTLMQDIEEMSNVHKGELATLRAELDRREPVPPSTKVECIQLRSCVASLEDKLVDLTQRFADLDHSWDEEKAALKADRVDGLELELL